MGGQQSGAWTVEWSAMLESAAEEEQPVGLRIAAARAIGTCRPSSVSGWLLALSLLEDDDDEVREAMACSLGALVAPASAGEARAPPVVAQQAWMTLASLFPAAEIRDALRSRRATVPATIEQTAFAVFPAEQANFYAEPDVENKIVAHLLDGAEWPLGWSGRVVVPSGSS